MRVWCWIFGCNYESEIGGGWCQNCNADYVVYRGPVWRREPPIFHPVWPVGCGGPILYHANCPYCNQIHERRFMESFEEYNTWSEQECKFGHHDLCPHPDCCTCLCHRKLRELTI